MADDLRGARRKADHLQGKLDAAERRIRELETEVRRLSNTVGQQRSSSQERRRKDSRVRERFRDTAAYIELLELRLHGAAVSFADESGSTLRMNTVPRGWLVGLREENRMLRDRLRELGGLV